MPIHNGRLVDRGLFHHFHQHWIATLCDQLNTGELPNGYYALIARPLAPIDSEIPIFEGPPIVEQYAARANHIAVYDPLGEIVAVLEIVSPGNKSSRGALGAFVEKAMSLLNQGIHLLVIDLLPPTKRDPQGIHGVIWEEINDEPFELPPDKPLTLASYMAVPTKTAYVEPVAVGDALPAMPLFLAPDVHVPVALEETYMQTWSVCPEPMRELIENGVASQ